MNAFMLEKTEPNAINLILGETLLNMQFICESHIAEVKCVALSLFLQTLII